MTASLTSISARINPCCPTSSRSQLRMSPSKSPSIRRVPETMSVPLKLDPTPITVFGSVGTSTFVVRLRNFMKVPFCSTDSEGACDRFHQGTGARPSRSTTGSGPVLPRSENPPGFEQTLEVLLGVVLELHFSAFTTGG